MGILDALFGGKQVAPTAVRTAEDYRAHVLDSEQPVKSFTVAQATGAGSMLIAPWVGTLKTFVPRGSKTPAGSFAAQVCLRPNLYRGDAKTPKLGLGSMKIAGDFASTDFAVHWTSSRRR